MNKIKMLITNLLLISLIIGSLNVHAEDVIHINKNDPAPFSGFLFTEEKAKQTRIELLELDKKTIQLESATFQLTQYKQIYNIQIEEIKLYQNQNDRLMKQEQSTNTVRIIWFVLGVIATGGAFYGAHLLML